MPILIVLTLSLTPETPQTPSDLPLRAYIHTVWKQHDGVPLGRVETMSHEHWLSGRP